MFSNVSSQCGSACRVVAVFRSVESEEKAKRHLGNPPENALITVIGALGICHANN